MKYKFCFLILCLVFAGCKFPYIMQREFTFDKSEYTRNKKLWEANGINNYEYTHEYTDVLDGKTYQNVYTITNKKCTEANYKVQDENSRDFVPMSDGKKVSNGTNLKYSIDDWFERIERDYNTYKNKNFEKDEIALVKMEVEYDKELGYPKKYDFIIYYDDDVVVTYSGSIPEVTYLLPSDRNPTVINIVEFIDTDKKEAEKNEANAGAPENGEGDTDTETSQKAENDANDVEENGEN